MMNRLPRIVPVPPCILTALVLGLAACAGTPARPERDKAAEIDRLMTAYAHNGQFNGAVLVSDHGDIIYKKAFGKASLELDVPNTPEMAFSVGSVTKPFTATLVMQLVQEGKLKLDGTLGEYLPVFASTPAARVTLHQLLTHTSGLSSRINGGDETFWKTDARRKYTVEQFIREHIPGTLDFEPGSQWRYCNAGYFVLGAIIERVTGQDYAHALESRILAPAGMSHSGLDHQGLLVPKRASGYTKQLGEYRPAEYCDASVYYAAGGLYATVEDIYRWDRALSSDKLLSADTKRQVFTRHMRDSGYGWFIEQWPVGKTEAKLPVVLHTGGVFGFSSLLVRSTSDESLIVLMDNTARGDMLTSIGHGLFDVLHGQTPPAPKKSLSDVLGPVVVREGIEAGVREFRRLQSENSEQVDLSESSVNTFGYQLLRAPRVDDAIRVFQWNAEAFPNSGNVYDSLAEAYVAQGDKARGIENYRKALELDPKNGNAKTRLEALNTP